MHSEKIIIDSVLALWKSTVDRATKLFANLSEEDAGEPVAPGRNRVVYLLGHLTAVHDRMIPLLGLGERVHPEMDASFVSNPDSAGGDLPPLADLKNRWENVNGHLLVLMQQDVSPSWWAQRHTSVSEVDFEINPTRNRLSILLSSSAAVRVDHPDCTSLSVRLAGNRFGDPSKSLERRPILDSQLGSR